MKDGEFLETCEVRAIANYFRTFHDADSFITALEYARALTEAGELASAGLWNQIAEEISHLETAETLERCLTKK
jgi:hypothetical protein